MSSERWPPHRVRLGAEGRTLEGRGQARAVMEAAVAVKAGGAVMLSSWYLLALVCARSGDTTVKRQTLSVY